MCCQQQARHDHRNPYVVECVTFRIMVLPNLGGIEIQHKRDT